MHKNACARVIHTKQWRVAVTNRPDLRATPGLYGSRMYTTSITINTASSMSPDCTVNGTLSHLLNKRGQAPGLADQLAHGLG